MKHLKSFKIVVAEPCAEPEENMSPSGCGMFCNTCQKEVIDFMGLTDDEVINIFKHRRNVCGSFSKEQLAKTFQYEEVLPAKMHMKLWASVLTLFSLFDVREASAQVRQTKTEILPPSKIATKENKGLRISGQILNDKPIAGVRVEVSGTDVITTTDGNGNFVVELPISFKEGSAHFIFTYGNYAPLTREITFSEPGMEPHAYRISEFNQTDLVSISSPGLHTGGNISDFGGRGGGSVFIVDDLVPNGYTHRDNIFRRSWRKLKGVFN